MKNLYSCFYLAFTLLTYLKLPFWKNIVYSEGNMAASTIFYPLIGLFYGIILSIAFLIMKPLPLPSDLTVIIIIAIPYILNRFLHIDGLLDSFDGILAGRTQEERLSIMKDSRIGTFAFAGGFLFLSAKMAFFSEILKTEIMLPLLLLMPVLSRTAIVISAYFGKYPKKQGFGRTIIGKINIAVFLKGLLLFALITGTICFFLNVNIIFIPGLIVCSILWIILFQSFCNRKIGGITGDSLGAISETIELVALAFAAVWIKI